MNIKTIITQTFDQVAEGYDNPALRFFSIGADTLIQHLDIKAGSKVLDICTGTGYVAVAAAQAVGKQGSVVGIDLSAKMLTQATEKCQKLHLNHVSFQVMDAENLDFQNDYFDYVICAFGLFFCNDMQKAIIEWKRVLKPKGVLLFTCFAENAFEPMKTLYKQRLSQMITHYDSPIAKAAQQLADRNNALQLLEQANFNAIHADSIQLGYHFVDYQDWWQVIWNSAWRAPLNQLTAQQLEQLKIEHLKEISPNDNAKNLWLNVETHFISGQK